MTYVVSSIRVVIYTAEEGGCRVLAQVFCEEVPAARMLVHEVRQVVNEASDGDEGACLCLLLEAIPRDYGKIVAIRGPDEMVLRLAQFLELHGKLTLADFIVRECLRIIECR